MREVFWKEQAVYVKSPFSDQRYIPYEPAAQCTPLEGGLWQKNKWDSLRP